MEGEGELFQNKYKLGEKLGEGGMGVVYAAVQMPSCLPVAIKFVSARNLQGERLLREARVLAKLSHGNLVRLYDFDRTKSGDYYIVMELVEGDTLHALIRHARKHGKLLEPQHAHRMLHILAQVADGIEAAHKAGIVHRDLKPENIIVSKGGIARVVDFGLAKNPNAAALPPIGAATNPANVVGTPRYMAPEQVCGREVDARTDIYAMGVCLYEALTGRIPFEREGDDLGVTEIMGRHCFAEPTPLREHIPSCSERISRLVLRCLAKDPSERYQAARELALAIRTVLTEELAEEQARAKREAAGLNARETEPQPAEWKPGAVLPFVMPSNQVPQRRLTSPMSPPAMPPQPTFAVTKATTHRGVGFTTKMARPSGAALAAAEAEVAREKRGVGFTAKMAQPSAVALAAAEAEETRDSSRPGPASASGVHLKKQHHAPSPSSLELDPTWPDARVVKPHEEHPMKTQHADGSTPTTPRPHFGVPRLAIAPIAGAALAVLVLVTLALLRPLKPAMQPSEMPTTTARPSSQPSLPSSATAIPSSQPSPPSSATATQSSPSATATTTGTSTRTRKAADGARQAGEPASRPPPPASSSPASSNPNRPFGVEP